MFRKINIRTGIPGFGAAVLLAGASAQGAFAMGSAANDPWINARGSTEAVTADNGGFRHIGGRVGWIAVAGERDGGTEALVDGGERFLGGRAGRQYSGDATRIN